MTQFKVGDYVRYAAAHGSYGIIEAPRDYDDGFYVRWYYGKDIKGEYITELSSVATNRLVEITLEELDERRNRQGFDDCEPKPPKFISVGEAEYQGRKFYGDGMGCNGHAHDRSELTYLRDWQAWAKRKMFKIEGL